jgi:hypothetical protein
MIGLSSYLMSIIMVTNSLNVHYYERYVSLVCCLDNTLEPRRAMVFPAYDAIGEQTRFRRLAHLLKFSR